MKRVPQPIQHLRKALGLYVQKCLIDVSQHRVIPEVIASDGWSHCVRGNAISVAAVVDAGEFGGYCGVREFVYFEQKFLVFAHVQARWHNDQHPVFLLSMLTTADILRFLSKLFLKGRFFLQASHLYAKICPR